MSSLSLDAVVPTSAWQARRARWRAGLRRALVSPAMVFGLAMIALMVLCAALAPWLAPFDPNAQDASQRLLTPGATHWLGTDQLGRDLLSRLIHGTQPTLMIVALVAVIAAPLGLLVGMCAGYFGGWLDTVLMRLTDVVMAFPRLVLALAMVAVLGPGIVNAVIAIAITAWPPARLARTETQTCKRADHIQAARVQGLSSPRILWGHVLPLCLPSTVVRVTLDMAGIILTAAGLGFLGLGAQPPMSEWGAMIASGRPYIFDQWWVAAVPGVAILLGSLAFNLVGDGLRDVLDPKHG